MGADRAWPGMARGRDIQLARFNTKGIKPQGNATSFKKKVKRLVNQLFQLKSVCSQLLSTAKA